MKDVADSGLRGRRDECARLDGLLAGARAGRSAALVMRGEAGLGKSALLEYVAESAADLRVLRAAGVESEMELAFAALHQMCRPALDRLGLLPGPQRAALGTAFGLQAGPPPDRFLIGLAVLSLLAEVAEDGPLVCLIDDARWLDQASARVLAFVARRLVAESVLMIFTVREPDAELDGLPELLVQGLREDDARQLLRSVVPWPLDEQVAEQIVAETRGNPLALLELPRGLSPAQLTGGFGLPEAPPEVVPPPGRIEDSFLRRAEALPGPARLWLVVAAAEPTGDLALVWRAAAQLGIPAAAADSAAQDGLVEIGARVRFRHPLVRSAIYRSASRAERQAAHRALAEATDPQRDPDRRAWHQAQAASEPDEDLAAELERSADRAQARGGLTAAAAFLERAAALTPDPARRAAGRWRPRRPRPRPACPPRRWSCWPRRRRGQPMSSCAPGSACCAARWRSPPATAPMPRDLLLHTARQLEPLDVRLARETYLDALASAIFVGRLAGGAGLPEVARAALGAPPAPQPARAPDLLLDGLAVLITDGYEAGKPALQPAVAAFRNGDLTLEDELRWFFVACHAAHDLWDDEGWYALSARHLKLARDVGALSVLPLALAQRVGVHLHTGEFGAAAALVEETTAITEATRNDLPPYSALALAGWQGRAAEATSLMHAAINGLTVRGEGMGLGLVRHTSAVLSNGLGRYRDALTAADEASAYPQELGFANWGLAELVEAAVRCGETARAADAVERLARTTGPSGTPWGLGIEARSRALVSEGEAAELQVRQPACQRR